MKKNVSAVSPGVLNEIRRSGHVAEATGFRTMDAGEVTAGAGPRPVRVEFVAPNYFDVLGVVAVAGRTLTVSDAGTAPVPIVLSESLWRSAFGADAGVVGRAITLNATLSVVVGVARGFRGMLAERPADVLVPAAAASLLEPTAATAGLRVIARMASGASPVVAAQKLAPLYIPSDSMMRGTDLRVMLVNARHGVSDVRETLERPLTVGLALVAVLMLLASANAGGLLLARFAARQGEFGVRVAIGAGRGRLLRQVLCEVVLLAAMAGAAGLVVAAIRGAGAAAIDADRVGPIGFRGALRLEADRVHRRGRDGGGAHCGRRIGAEAAAHQHRRHPHPEQPIGGARAP